MLDLELPETEIAKEELSMEFILKNNWNLVLDTLSRGLDPWNVDITKLASRYKKYIQSMEDYNLKVPARFILVCSILLRMKADILFGKRVIHSELPIEEFNEDFFDNDPQKEQYIPNISFPVRRAPVRRVTLEDLKSELAKAMNIEYSRKKRWSERKTDFGIHLKKSNIEEKLNGMMEILRNILVGHKTISFEELLQDKNKKEVVEKFVNILRLENKDQIKCSQKEFLGKILIKLKKEMQARENE